MINFNGQIVSSKQPVFTGHNRAFRYGDGLFESIRMFNGKMPFLKYHCQRLFKGMTALKIEIPTNYSLDFFKNEIIKTIKDCKSNNHRIRLTVFRSGNGLYTPHNNNPTFLIEWQELPSSKFNWNKKGLSVGLFDDIKINPSPISCFKSCSALPYVMANIHKKENRWDDVLLINHIGSIVSGGSSNIFLLKNNTLLSPPTSDGCVAGTMRKVVFKLGDKLNIETEKRSFSIGELAGADEIFLTNAPQGIRWVENVIGVKTEFKNKRSYKIFEALQELV